MRAHGLDVDTSQCRKRVVEFGDLLPRTQDFPFENGSELSNSGERERQENLDTALGETTHE